MTLLGMVQGGREHEGEYHRRFAQHHLHGEWLSGAILPAMMQIIAKATIDPAPKTTNVIVVGDSELDFISDSNRMAEKARLEAAVSLALGESHAKMPIAWVIIIGGERQIKTFVEQWAKRDNVKVQRYWPNWKRYGKGAAAMVGRQLLRAVFDPKVPRAKSGWEFGLRFMNAERQSRERRWAKRPGRGEYHADFWRGQLYSGRYLNRHQRRHVGFLARR